METQRQQLIDFLKGCRGRLSPAEVGLPDTNRRRTPGLRREDVAALGSAAAAASSKTGVIDQLAVFNYELQTRSRVW